MTVRRRKPNSPSQADAADETGLARFAAATRGRVTVVYFWASFVPESLAGLTKLAQLHEELNDFGLVTVAAHGPGGSRQRLQARGA